MLLSIIIANCATSNKLPNLLYLGFSPLHDNTEIVRGHKHHCNPLPKEFVLIKIKDSNSTFLLYWGGSFWEMQKDKETPISIRHPQGKENNQEKLNQRIKLWSQTTTTCPPFGPEHLGKPGSTELLLSLALLGHLGPLMWVYFLALNTWEFPSITKQPQTAAAVQPLSPEHIISSENCHRPAYQPNTTGTPSA